MSNSIAPRSRQFVSGLAAVATTALLMSTLIESLDPRLLKSHGVSSPPTSAVTADLRRDALDVRQA